MTLHPAFPSLQMRGWRDKPTLPGHLLPQSYAKSRGDKSPWSSEGTQTGHPHPLLCVFHVSSLSPVAFTPHLSAFQVALFRGTHSINSCFLTPNNISKMNYYVNLCQLGYTERQGESRLRQRERGDNWPLISLWIGLKKTKASVTATARMHL